MAPVTEVCDAGLIGDTTEATEFTERTAKGGGVKRCGVGTRPGCNLVVDNFLDVVHAGCEASTHVDGDVWRGTDHDVEVGFGLDWRACQDA